MVAALNGYVRSTQRAASENNSATVRSREAHPARTASNETRDRRTGMAFGLFQVSGATGPGACVSGARALETSFVCGARGTASTLRDLPPREPGSWMPGGQASLAVRRVLL